MSYTLLSESWPVARKQHRCIWCGQHIEPDEKYRRERSVYDGEMQDHKWHPECDEDFKAGLAAGDDAEFTPYSAERPAGVGAAARTYLHPTRVDALIAVLEGECDGLAVTRETAEAILHYLDGNAPPSGVRASQPANVVVTDAGWAQLWVHGVHIQSGYGQGAKECCDKLAERINANAAAGATACATPKENDRG